MPTILVLRFPWGRYHATPWGRHVNEGAVEIPPSPWRLLRALYATWRTRVPELPEPVMLALLARLAEPPVFCVPRYEEAHTRHYYPDTVHRTGAASTDRTFDSFAVFDRLSSTVDPELAIRWAFDLPPDQHEALDRLAASIPYFGRADSLCTARLVPDWQPYAHEIWSPLDVASEVDDRAPATGVLAPLLPLDMAALLARPLDVRRNGLVYPAGAHLIGYQRGSTALTPRRRTTTATTPVTAVRFSILQTALPPCTDSIIYTDLLRRAALHQLGTLRDRKTTSRLAGKDELGDKLTGNQHAHYLPITDGHRLTSLVVWVPGTLDDDELKALGQLRRLSSHRDNQRLTIRLSGVGDVTDVAPELTGPATTWTSHTPFTPTGHRKPSKDQETHLRAEISRELRHRDQPGLANLDIQPGHWQAWRRHRPSARRDQRQGTSWQPSEFLRITLEQPVPGPLTLGHLSHFGLGLFTPEP